MKRLKTFDYIFCGVLRLFGRNEKKIDTQTPVFKTENIKSITLFWTPKYMKGVQVPLEHMEELSTWIGTFTVGEKIKDILCGQNTITFKIEYSDESTVVNGIDTITIDGVIYRLKKGRTPECFYKLFATSSREE